jgi:putative drug exporter of the RND superfamily
VPALAYDIGPRIWWPGKLGRQEAEQRPGQAEALLVETPAR